MSQAWRDGGQPLARPQQPQLARPVRQRSTQALHVGVPGPQLGLDGCDLLLASVDSCRALPAFLGEFLERAPVAVESRLLAGQRLPALHDDINVLRVQFDADARALG